jgi:hypothetical protein
MMLLFRVMGVIGHIFRVCLFMRTAFPWITGTNYAREPCHPGGEVIDHIAVQG